MTRFRDNHRAARLGPEDGFTMVEVLAAILILMIGVIGLIGGFDSARKLSLLSERRTSTSHRAQQEIERLQSTPYAELAMASVPVHSTESTNPDYYVKEGTPAEYQYGSEATEAEPLVVAGKGECTSTVKTECGVIASSPSGRECSKYIGACEWKDGQQSGNVYDFVTWHTDGKCGEKCPTKENYKRLTVVVTVKVPSGTRAVAPVRVSTLVAES
ncbi:MAG: prepilin-type N-terminal cleavage/methylation domain-containing protein [Solirubrobacterales bacterium]